MTIISTSPALADGDFPRGYRPWCPGCRSAAHLVLESIDPVRPPAPDRVDVAYTRMECDSFYAHPVSVAEAGAILDGHESTAAVLQFGGDFIHCGKTMKTSGTELRCIYTPLRTDGPAEDLLEVYLRTKVLRCGCGFQMEIPH